MRIILHIDMDAFFAAIEERDKPRLRGLPIVVGADPANGKGRGVVSTANYIARKYGIHSAQPISIAWRYSQNAKKEGKPEAVFLSPNIAIASRESNKIFEYLRTVSEAVEPASIDEAYADISATGSYAKAEALAVKIKEYVKKHHKLTCTIGIGPNKLIAKIAAQEKKPDGLTVIRDSEVQRFLDPKLAKVIPGIGPKTYQALTEKGITTIKQLRQLNKNELVEAFGKNGVHMYQASRGIDESPIVTDYETKSIGEQQTFDKDTLDATIILAAFKGMAKSVAGSLKKEKKKFRTVVIVVRFSDFETLTRSHTIEEASDAADVLEKEALQLLLPFLDSRENPKHKKIRLVGVRAEKLESTAGKLF